jgi:hypothetical protein
MESALTIRTLPHQQQQLLSQITIAVPEKESSMKIETGVKLERCELVL